MFKLFHQGEPPHWRIEFMSLPAGLSLMLLVSIGCQPMPSSSSTGSWPGQEKIDGLNIRIASLEGKLLSLEKRVMLLSVAKNHDRPLKVNPMTDVPSPATNTVGMPPTTAQFDPLRRIDRGRWEDILKFQKKSGLSTEQAYRLVEIREAEILERREIRASAPAKTVSEARATALRIREKYIQKVERTLGKILGRKWRSWRDEQLERIRARLRQTRGAK